MEFGEKPPRRLFHRHWEQPGLQDFARFGIDGAVQPVVVAIDADHLLINRELICTHRRHGLVDQLCVPVMNSDVTTLDS